MKILPVSVFAAILAFAGAAQAIEPIEGSITYGGHRAYLKKSPIGSTFQHDFIDQTGRNVRETYKVQPDRSVKLVAREYMKHGDIWPVR